MRRLSVLCVLLTMCFAIKAQIVHWTFETSLPASSGPHSAEIGTGIANGFHAAPTATYSNPTGNGSAESFSSNSWAVNDYYEFQFSTTAYRDIIITWDATGSSTGPRDFKVQYSIDGTSFIDAVGINSSYQLPTIAAWSSATVNAASTRTLDLTAITLLNNAALVVIRLVNTSTTSIDGGTVAAGGTSRVDNFIVNANFIAAASTDFFRTKNTGNWNAITTWESSPTGAAGTWINATQAPTSAANTIQIRNGHIVTLSASASADQLIIESGGLLNYAAGTFTVTDGTADDVTIQNGGVFTLSLDNTPPTFATGSATVNILTGGILRIAAAGLTGAGAGVNANNFIYQHQSILEYTLLGGFATSGVVFFPNADAVTIPIFRVLHNGAPSNILVGAGTATTFNGIFENNGTSDIIWQNAGNKIFRNGIRGTGNIIANASAASAKFIINGATAELGGSGSLTVPATGGLEIGTPSLVTMTANKTVTGNIALLNAGQINLGAFDLTVTGTVSNTTVTSYIRTNGPGKLTLNNVATGAGGKLFPIGLTSINPLFIQSNTTANYSARIVEPVTPPIYNDNFSVLRSWYISSSATSPGATISFGYSYPADCGSSFINTGASIQVGVNVNNVWNIHQSALTATPFPLVPGTFIVTPTNPINTFTSNGTEYPFVVANNGAVLPLDNNIIATAQKTNTTNHISWKVFNVDDLRKFELQRSTNNGPFQMIATVVPSSQSVDYNYSDAALATGTNLYRIKGILHNGAAVYSNTVAVINDSKGLLITSLAPNPVNDKATFSISSAKQVTATFQVYNINGVLVKTWRSSLKEGNTIVTVDISSLASGIYHIAATANDVKAVCRMMKQ